MRAWAIAIFATLMCGSVAEAQKVELALDTAADYSAVYPLTKMPANIRQFIAIVSYGSSAPKKIMPQFTTIDSPGHIGLKTSERNRRSP